MTLHKLEIIDSPNRLYLRLRLPRGERRAHGRHSPHHQEPPGQQPPRIFPGLQELRLPGSADSEKPAGVSVSSTVLT